MVNGCKRDDDDEDTEYKGVNVELVSSWAGDVAGTFVGKGRKD